MVWEAWGQPDHASQQIDFVSDYVVKMLGYSVAEWLSTPNFWLMIVPPEEREQAARNAAALYAGGQGGMLEMRWMTQDGRTLWTESYIVVMRDEAGNPAGMRGVTMDISERKRAEADMLRPTRKGRGQKAAQEFHRPATPPTFPIRQYSIPR